MPEVIEIRKYAEFIKNKLKNQFITDIKILNGRYKKHKPFENYKKITDMLPLKLLDVKTKGKFLYFIFDKNFYLFSTLGLSGGWCYLSNKNNKYNFSEIMDEFEKYEYDTSNYIKNALNHLNVEFVTEKGSLYYYDVLSFGTIKVIDNIEDLNKKLNKIGPDIMDIDFELFISQITKTKNLQKKIGIVLMDQKTISGIGNYLRADVLYLSKINPFRKVKTLTNLELKYIFNNSKLLTWGQYDLKMCKKLGFLNDKLPADYDRLFFVYMEDTDIHNYKIIKKELYEGSQKRFIYYVPQIQK